MGIVTDLSVYTSRYDNCCKYIGLNRIYYLPTLNLNYYKDFKSL